VPYHQTPNVAGSSDSKAHLLTIKIDAIEAVEVSASRWPRAVGLRGRRSIREGEGSKD